VSPGLAVPTGNEAFLLGHGVGTQNWACQPAASLGQVAWTLFAPQATFFDDQGEQLIAQFSSQPFGGWHRARDVAGFPGYELRAFRRCLQHPETRDTLARLGMFV